jgi:hypothetical protein
MVDGADLAIEKTRGLENLIKKKKKPRRKRPRRNRQRTIVMPRVASHKKGLGLGYNDPIRKHSWPVCCSIANVPSIYAVIFSPCIRIYNLQDCSLPWMPLTMCEKEIEASIEKALFWRKSRHDQMVVHL